MQIPIAVAENRVGNKSALDKKTRLKVLDVPVFPIIIKRGIQLVNEWKSIIIAPPIKVKMRQIRKEVRTPYLL